MALTPALNNTFGINEINNISIANLQAIGQNITEPMDFFGNVNQIVYGGLFFFVMMWVMVAIIYLALQQFKNKPLINSMYACALVTVVGFLFRAIETVVLGTTYSFINDNQMWMFPILAIILAGIVWATKDN